MVQEPVAELDARFSSQGASPTGWRRHAGIWKKRRCTGCVIAKAATLVKVERVYRVAAMLDSDREPFLLLTECPTNPLDYSCGRAALNYSAR